ncbi:Pnap_2097 family protein [Bradyrhizobium genosp. A]|uniref:Pnap_2097 family protein n=1 Tax=Bradyrhizobium genosp. A TaxID=83626 RepID=UPI003CF6B10D
MSREIPSVLIGMPHLGPCGLSENWMLRHVGDVHWNLICSGLGKRSRFITDESGNRLYASFVRVTWTSSKPLSAINESDELRGSTSMVRCGENIFISETQLSIADALISLRLVSMFSRREHNTSNKRLLLSAPVIPLNCPIKDIEEVPSFVVQHRLLRNAALPVHQFGDVEFDTAAQADWSFEYQINGYMDFNGANLLYFASYPTIADICVSRTDLVSSRGSFDWFVIGCPPIGRDIFYYGNANITETINCALAPKSGVAGLEAYSVDLFRSSDGARISKQFVLRQNVAHAHRN